MLFYLLMSKIIYDVSCVNISNYFVMFRRYEFLILKMDIIMVFYISLLYYLDVFYFKVNY